MLLEPIFAHAAADPSVVSFVDESGSYTRGQFAAMTAGLGRFLATQTTRDKIGLLLPAGVGFAASFYGTLLAGKAVVPINFLLGDKEIAHVMTDSGIDTVVTIPQLAGKLNGSPLKVIDLVELMGKMQAAMASAPAAMESAPAAMASAPAAMASAPAAMASAPAAAPAIPAKSADDLAVLMYTSGTSGMPKGVELTYGNLQSDVESAIEHANLTGHHKFLGILPLFHSTGLLATLLAPTFLGSQAVYIARFSPVATIQAIRKHGISIIAAVPSMYAAICRLKDAGPEDFKQMYAVISGGEPLPAAVQQAFQAKFNLPIYEGYGLTETIGPVAFNVPGKMEPGSVGKLIPGAEVKTVDDDGNAAATGEIWLRGPMIFHGYYNLPKETAAAITPDGYFKTGDLGHVDSNGYLHVTGRKKELIIVAGEKAVPREIEEVLLRHPDVADAAVVGKKDPSRGEVVVAFVISKEGHEAKPDQLRDFCRSENLMQWKVPREITVVADLPRSPTGKVLKRVLSERVNGGTA